MFKRAVKEKLKGRIALAGPSGSGKTYTALKLASSFGGSIAVIDTEHGSATRYADLFEFDCCDLQDHHPATYIKAINAAVRAGYQTIVIDSLTHAWLAELDLVGGRFDKWKEVRPLERKLIDAMLSAPAYIIATMRTKTEYVLEEYTAKDGSKKKAPTKKGAAPIQSSGIEYEFDICGDLDLQNTLTISKSRCSVLHGEVIPRPDENLANTILGWLNSGVEPQQPPAAPQPVEIAENRAGLLEATYTLAKQIGIPAAKELLSSRFNVDSREALDDKQLAQFRDVMKLKLAA